MKALAIVTSSAALLIVSVLPAIAVSDSQARQVCLEAAAASHNQPAGNIQVRKVKASASGAEVNLVVDDVEVNCMVTADGKVRYVN